MLIQKPLEESNYGYKLSLTSGDYEISFTYTDFSAIDNGTNLVHRTRVLKRLFLLNSNTDALTRSPSKQTQKEETIVYTTPNKVFIEWVDDLLSYCATPPSTLTNSVIVRFLAKHIGENVTLKETCWIPV